MSTLKDPLPKLQEQLEGEIRDDIITKTLYSTDASMYREIPLAVTWPKNKEDLLKIIKYAVDSGTGLIIRGAGTSLAGQVVGSGLIVDISKHMTRVLELNVEEKWVRIEPGVILEELNKELIKHGLFFGPETSTANRCTMGGMLGNNACGLHSLRYGSTREHTIEVQAILSDGSEVEFSELSDEEFRQKCDLQSLEGNIYRKFAEILDS
ncbi:MAG: FAD-binding oxidoreductase, partial [Bacteroidales bacterium]|nr:FAD-binding oxidoreductase [Bacteroidales bacterium]